MKIRINTFKKQILSGQKTYGIWNGLPHIYAAEICAGAGFDWVCIDGEHSPFSFDSILQNLLAIQSHNVTSIVRIPSADPVLIKQLLDAGAQNILIPMIETVEQATLMAHAMRYPPNGFRGVGTGLARAAQWDRVNDYLKLADAQMCCIGQIETLKGVQALDEILKVPGMDVLFIGPADLAASMGYLGQSDHPEVVNIVKDCIQKIVTAGKVAGFLTLSKALIKTYTDAGALMIGVGADSLLLEKATKALADEYSDAEDDSNTEY